MVWHSELDTTHIHQPELSGLALKVKYCLTIHNNLSVLAFRDNIAVPLTLDLLSPLYTGQKSWVKSGFE